MLMSFRKFEERCHLFAVQRYLEYRRNAPHVYDPHILTEHNLAAIRIHEEGGIVQPDLMEMIGVPLNIVMEAALLEQMSRIPQFVSIPPWYRERDRLRKEKLGYSIDDFERVITTQWMFALRSLLEIGGPLGAKTIYAIFEEALDKHKTCPEYRSVLAGYLWPDYSWMLGPRGKTILKRIPDAPGLDLRDLEAKG